MRDQTHYELHNERNRGAVRTILTVCVGLYLYWILRQGTGPRLLTITSFSVLVGFATVWNVAYWLYLLHVRNKQGRLHPALKYTATFGDCALVTVLLMLTDSTESRLFLLYIIVVISAGMRYGMRPAIFAAMSFNIMYGLLVFYDASEGRKVDQQTEIARVLSVWLLALYVGYLARRIEFLQNRVTQYRELVKRLTERSAP